MITAVILYGSVSATFYPFKSAIGKAKATWGDAINWIEVDVDNDPAQLEMFGLSKADMPAIVLRDGSSELSCHTNLTTRASALLFNKLRDEITPLLRTAV